MREQRTLCHRSIACWTASSKSQQLLRSRSPKDRSRIGWREKRTLLETFKGVGPIGSATLVADLPELGHLDSRKIAALVGLAPMSHESGDTAKRRRIKGGRMHVRNALYRCAIAATRTNKPIREKYQRLRNANKAPNVARVAVMRKMLVILNAMARDGTAWRDASE